MAKKRHETTLSGPDFFNSWYGTQIGPRWTMLSTACAQPAQHFSLSTGLLKPYFLDPASVVAALSLDIQPGQRVLDLCAAPGGKSLVIALRLFGIVPTNSSLFELGTLVENMPDQQLIEDESEIQPELATNSFKIESETSPIGSFFIANERSATRRGRLKRVLAEHLPESVQTSIRVTGHDATMWGQHEQDSYDRILLDIPCSSERHLIQAPSYLKDWSPRRSEQLAQQAYTMGLSAGRALKIGGEMLFCTCALSDAENDGAVERIIERSHKQAGRFGFKLEPAPATISANQLPGMETTSFGSRVWPDMSGGYGPLYFSRLRKTAVSP